MCPECGHGASLHGNGMCAVPITGGCSCGISPATIVDLVLADDRRKRDAELDRYLTGVKSRFEETGRGA